MAEQPDLHTIWIPASAFRALEFDPSPVSAAFAVRLPASWNEGLCTFHVTWASQQQT